ncbi:hypothetical protein PR003_g11417 [Phytophthora rubi]|uniref:Uncharacterized protein n=1 Tax=Phytophthora rubi TaxID=129364 RepID=A0A6A3P263_9STRA|nr:hypothetical protein PR002_g3048 [Phytophthora rubi]KAE9049493.1 hypothetical protein PR001_g3274 [Phytophthora rubi]KAE9338633.1 hypothetical protein PR003_g11417 [Phytophthora rubi]
MCTSEDVALLLTRAFCFAAFCPTGLASACSSPVLRFLSLFAVVVSLHVHFGLLRSTFHASKNSKGCLWRSA